MKGEVPRIRHRTVGKGIPIPSRIRSLGERNELPNGVRGRAPTENEFGYSTAVSIMLVAITLMILGCMFYTRKLNKKVSYGSDYVHRSVKITTKLRSPIGDSRCAVKITDR